MRIVVTLVAMLLASPALAMGGESCAKGQGALVLSDTEVESRGVTAKALYLSQAIEHVQAALMSGRQIDVMVTECPKYGVDVFTTVLLGMPNFRLLQGYEQLANHYGIYVTVGFLRYTEESELVQVARQQTCLIYSGIADYRYRRTDFSNDAILRCRLTVAKTAGDSDEVQWFQRRLGNPPETHSAETHAIDDRLQSFGVRPLRFLPQFPSK